MGLTTVYLNVNFEGNVSNNVEAQGRWGTVEWAVDQRGAMPAREFFYSQTLSHKDRARLLALFQRLADEGRISNREKFRLLGDKAGTKARGFWEFKDFQLRFIGDFRPGRRFVIAHGLLKKRDNLSPSDIDIATRVLSEHDKLETRERK